MRARLPDRPLSIAGRLALQDRSPRTIRYWNVSATVQLGEKEMSACYTVSDALGATLEQFKVHREPGMKPRFEYAAGNPLQPAPAPDLFAKVQESSVTWADLTLPFLWWTGGRVVGTDSAKGRDCFLVEVNAPAGEMKTPGYLRLWIDTQYRMLIRADECGPDGALRRRLTVQSFRKVDDEWMIKEISVDETGARYRSMFSLREIRKLDAAP